MRNIRNKEKKLFVLVICEPEKVYVSCECSASKRDGMLFKKVLRELGVSARAVLYIGNAIRSDIINAWKRGLHVYRVSRSGIVSTDKYFELGFQRFGRLIFEFIKWIHRQSKDHREGGERGRRHELLQGVQGQARVRARWRRRRRRRLRLFCRR